MIPRIIWQTYKSRQITPQAEPLIQSWKQLNPDYEYRFLADVDIDEFMEEHFDAQMVRVFRALPLGVMRADMWRYAVLYVHGGIYTDIDTECRVPIDCWLPRDKGLVVGLENDTHFCQWTFAAMGGHGALLEVLNLIRDTCNKSIDTSNPNFVHRCTGPGIWTVALRQYLNCSEFSIRKIFQDRAWDEYDVQMLDIAAFNEKYVRHHFGSQLWKDEIKYESWVDHANVCFAGDEGGPERDPGWTLTTEEDRFVLSNTRLQQHIACNASAVMVLELCDGTRSLEKIGDILYAQIQSPSADLRAQIKRVVYELMRLGAIQTP